MRRVVPVLILLVGLWACERNAGAPIEVIASPQSERELKASPSDANDPCRSSGREPEVCDCIASVQDQIASEMKKDGALKPETQAALAECAAMEPEPADDAIAEAAIEPQGEAAGE